MAGDNESKLDQVLLALGQMAGRCDSIDRRIDAMKKSDAGDKSLTEGGEFPGDIATAKRLAADTARYTKYGSNCNPGFADSVSVDPVQAMNLEAQELRAKLRKVEQAQKNLFQNMRPLSAEEESRCASSRHALTQFMRRPATPTFGVQRQCHTNVLIST